MSADNDARGRQNESGNSPSCNSTCEADDTLSIPPDLLATGFYDQIDTIVYGVTEQHASPAIAPLERSKDRSGTHGASSLVRILKSLSLWGVIWYLVLSIVSVLVATVLLIRGWGGLKTGSHILSLAFRNLVSILVPLVMVIVVWGGHKGFGWYCSVPCAVAMFSLVCFFFHEEDARSYSAIRPWFDGIGIPQSFEGCDARVSSRQAVLFTEDIYKTQFSRTLSVEYQDVRPFNASASAHVRHNTTLCSSGFEANLDLYGLGIRTGMYLQWVSALLANNLLSATRQEVQKLYLAFSLAVCLATSVASLKRMCTFAIEIEVLYWMYWGGYTIVFGTAPCSIQMGNRSQWSKLRWTTVMFFLTHMAMSYHGMWYAWYAYDRRFARMPCGTYHFFIPAMLDPSYEYWLLRDLLMFFARPVAVLVVCLFPAAGISLASALKHTIQDFALYQWLFPRRVAPNGGPEGAEDYQKVLPARSVHDEVQQGERKQLIRRFVMITDQLYRVYEVTFGTFGYLLVPRWNGPYHGIRLVTPLDVQNRRLYRITWALIGFFSCSISIVAIEMLLRWNRVVGVYSITSTGQYFALMIGLESFVSVIWSLLQQETERRRKQRIHSNNEFHDSLELQTFSQTFSDALSHAFSQPDEEFLSNSGGLPVEENSEDDGLNPSALSNDHAEIEEPYTDYLMSGALPSNNDNLL